MGLIEPGYLTGIYHPDRYFMADYHPEYGMPKFLRGVASISDPLGSSPGITDSLGSTHGIIDTLNSEVSLQ